ncbi:collagen alpha-1(XII) chain-like [Pungitius pungitius]|uniref:collagen alpha-1(XII) chain-like n=1 Tax=Pungitius pungitius TaxID=134920 RepID=UPI002E126E98
MRTRWKRHGRDPRRGQTASDYKWCQTQMNQSETKITDLTPDLDHSVSINSYYGSEESIPITGQLTIQSSNTSGHVKKPKSDAIN